MLAEILLLAAISQAHAAEFTCRRWSIRHMEAAKSVASTESFCFEPAHGRLLSLSCRESPDTCSALANSRARPVPLEQVTGEIGNPFHKACHLIDGTPQTLEIRVGSEWIPASRCLMEDGSFVDLGTLFKAAVKLPRI